MSSKLLEVELSQRDRDDIQEIKEREALLKDELEQSRVHLERFVLLSDSIERETERIIKSLLEKDVPIETQDSHRGATLEAIKKELSTKRISDVLKDQVEEVGELSSMLKEIYELIRKIVGEKNYLKCQVEDDLNIKMSIDRALKSQTEVPKELLITKIKYLENDLETIGRVID